MNYRKSEKVLQSPVYGAAHMAHLQVVSHATLLRATLLHATLLRATMLHATMLRRVKAPLSVASESLACRPDGSSAGNRLQELRLDLQSGIT